MAKKTRKQSKKPNWWTTDACEEMIKPLDDRLREVGARFVNEWDGPLQVDGRPSCLWALYTTGAKNYLVQIHQDGHGWQVWISASDTNSVEDTLAAII